MQHYYSLFLHISFKTPTVDNLLLAIKLLLSHLSLFISEILTLGPLNFQNSTFDAVFLFFPHPSTELGNVNCV